MKERIISLILAVIIGFFFSQFISRVEMKANQRLLNQRLINNHENSLVPIIHLPPPPIPIIIFKWNSKPTEEHLNN